MLYKEYYKSALRHLDVCKIMLEKLSSMDKKPNLNSMRERLLLDIYYLSGYVIETMISYSHFVCLGWKENDNIETYSLYGKGFKTHDLSAKITFAVLKARCDFSGITLLGIDIKNDIKRKMFHEWSEKVRYQHSKISSKLVFNENDLESYLGDIEKMFNQLKNKYFV